MDHLPKPALPWAAILSALAAAVVSSWLVLYQGWSLGQVLTVLSLFIAATGLVILIAMVLMTDRNDGQRTLRSFVETVKKDLQLANPFRW